MKILTQKSAYTILRKGLLALPLVITCYIQAYTQDLKFAFQTGIGKYAMGNLKDLNSDVLNDLTFPAKVVSNYPAFFYYKPTLMISGKNLSIGIQVAYYSTGSRISSKDYSGEYLFDTKINSLVPSIYTDLTIFKNKKHSKVMLFWEAGIVQSAFKLSEKFTVFDQDVSDVSYMFRSKNYNTEVGIKYEYIISTYISLQLNTSYFLQFGDDRLKTENDEVLNGRPDWGGYRLGLSFVFTFPKE